MFSPITPPADSLPGLCPAAWAWLHPRAQSGPAVYIHPAAAEPPQHSGAMEWQEKEKCFQHCCSWNYWSSAWLCC